MNLTSWALILLVFSFIVFGAFRMLRVRDESMRQFAQELKKLNNEIETLSQSETAHSDLITTVAEAALKKVNEQNGPV